MSTASDAGPAGAGGSSAGAVIELSHVSKTYAPRFRRPARALDDVSLRVAAGEVAGISGPATGGKSTLLALIAGLEQPTSGTVLVDGVTPRRFVEREGIAYAPQQMSLPAGWRVESALTRLAVLSGVRAATTRERVHEVMQRVELQEDRRTRLKALSRDALIRFGIAQAILADRRVISRPATARARAGTRARCRCGAIGRRRRSASSGSRRDRRSAARDRAERAR